MSSFDYLSVLVSIILGLAIANILARLAGVITSRERVNFYWPPIAWAIWLFFISIQHWWAQWSVRHTSTWTFLDFALLLLVPVGLFLLSALILPENAAGAPVNLSAWYFHNRAWFFAVLFFVPLLSIAEEIVRSGRMASAANFGFLTGADVIIVIAFFLKSRKAQEWITALAIAYTALYVGLLYLKLPG